jgi:UDP-N-acetylglucosamine--N-acetylmuramyl-(pentapeptide) pyrophosphoryl-undecaprenol N-acetylglucosamine transferase
MQSGIRAKVLKYIDDMPGQFGLTDLVISRAGASTIAEITAAGIPAILIPFPLAADDHQKKNAEALAERGAAILIEQKETDGRSLAIRLKHLSESPEELASMSKASKELAKRDSVKEIIEFMREIAA